VVSEQQRHVTVRYFMEHDTFHQKRDDKNFCDHWGHWQLPLQNYYADYKILDD
jgi:hypothetical protein